jgi:hypothetical protein
MTYRPSRRTVVAASVSPGEEWRARLWLAGDTVADAPPGAQPTRVVAVPAPVEVP